MSHKYLTAIVIAVAPFAAFSDVAPEGDPAAGEAAFNRQCVACHVIVDPDGNKLAGRNARTGPNLYGTAGGPIGAVDGFRYSDGLIALNESNLTWSEDRFVAYMMDPTNWLREQLNDASLRGKMAFKMRSSEDAENIFAYLHSLSE